MTASYWSMQICQPYSCHNDCHLFINENLPTIQLSQWLPHIDQWKSASHTAVTMTASYWSMKICQPYSCHNGCLILINENLPTIQLSQWLPHIDQWKSAHHTAVTMAASYWSMKICQQYSCHNDCLILINENLPTIQLSQWLPHIDQWKSANHTAVTMTVSYWSMKICQTHSCHNDCLTDLWKSANHTPVILTTSYWSRKMWKPYRCHNDCLILIYDFCQPHSCHTDCLILVFNSRFTSRLRWLHLPLGINSKECIGTTTAKPLI